MILIVLRLNINNLISILASFRLNLIKIYNHNVRINILIEIKSNLKEANIEIKLLILSLRTIIIIIIRAPTKETLNGDINNKEDKNNNFIMGAKKLDDTKFRS